MFRKQSSGHLIEVEGHNRLCFCHFLTWRKVSCSPCLFHEEKKKPTNVFKATFWPLLPPELQRLPIFPWLGYVWRPCLDINLSNLLLRMTMTQCSPKIDFLTFCSLNRHTLSTGTGDTKMNERIPAFGTSLLKGAGDAEQFRHVSQRLQLNVEHAVSTLSRIL